LSKACIKLNTEIPIIFLIQGERGIGKSSLFYYIDIVASGLIPTSEHTHMRFLTISVDLIGVETQLDVVRCIGRGLSRAISARDAVKVKAKAVWDFLTKWEVLGVRYHRDAGASEIEDARDDIVNKMADLLEAAADDLDGILILIDEADSAGEDSRLGEFVKLFTERLSRRSCHNVIIGMAGLPSIIGKLKASHASSARIFETFLLEALEPGERETVVLPGLQEANGKNEFQTAITDDALEMISDLSEG
jgi:hypothetical protein